jgi:hypothetical protein
MQDCFPYLFSYVKNEDILVANLIHLALNDWVKRHDMINDELKISISNNVWKYK